MFRTVVPGLLFAALYPSLPVTRCQAEVYTNGLTMIYREVSVSPRSSGVIEKLYVQEGQWVSEGDALGELDATKEKMDLLLTDMELEELQLSLEKMKLPLRPKEIEKMEIDLKKTQLAEDKTKTELERTKRLYDQKAVSDKDVADAKNAAEAAALATKAQKLSLELAKEGPRKEEIMLHEMKIAQKLHAQDQKKLALEKMTVLSSAAGVISKLYYAAGENAAAGQPFCDVLNTDSLYVELNLPVSEINRITVDQKATVTVPSVTSKSHPGRVVFISPTVDPASRTFKIRIEIANPQRALKPGLFATVSI